MTACLILVNILYAKQPKRECGVVPYPFTCAQPRLCDPPCQAVSASLAAQDMPRLTDSIYAKVETKTL
ncbi:hypothetical protein SAMN06265370_103239 [Puniceibacterium sediminis]|uniref:Uncharacterized protein n=1 Tax=Puniceibacterium sediminis TaxID=1608407 RepID=A0A238VWA9_9RHOB|nr:hypothetical protein SAMN06265370_103239 [Puniceibacterium sediminis]